MSGVGGKTCRTRDNRPSEPRSYGSCVADLYNTERLHSALAGQSPAEAYGAEQPVDMMDKAIALPISPQAQQQQQDVINKDFEA